MTPATIIQQARKDGVILTLSNSGTLKASGDSETVDRWLPVIRGCKPEIIAALIVGAGETAEPFDREAFEERAAICEFDGGLCREDSEAIAWHEDDRRRCQHCLNLLPNGVCRVASPSGPVVANRGYRPVDIPRRCEGYRPCLDDPDRRSGRERWMGNVAA
jgi:hypothetical protein